MLEPGQYLGEAQSAEMAYTSNNNEQVVVYFKVMDLDGKTLKFLTAYLVITDKTREFQMKALEAIGFDWDTLSVPTKPKRVGLVINIESDLEGKDRERIAFINDLNRGATIKKPMSEADKLAFKARMSGYAATSKAENPDSEPGSITKSTEPEPWDEDDIANA